MTKIYSNVIFILFASTSYAQSFGNEESLSLSQGAYFEVQDEDSIVQVGSALYNVSTGEVIGITFVEDEVSSVLEEELMGRWLAVDPQNKIFTGYSPYHFGLNSPIIVIDEDGEENVLIVGNDGVKGNGMFDAFFTAALKEAKTLRKDQPREKTTILLFVGNMTEADYAAKMKSAQDAGVAILAMKTSEEVVAYLNERPEIIKRGGNPKKNEMEKDLITDFEYYGHAFEQSLLLSSSMKEITGPGNLEETLFLNPEDITFDANGDIASTSYSIYANKKDVNGTKLSEGIFSSSSSAVYATCNSSKFAKATSETYTKQGTGATGAVTNYNGGKFSWSTGSSTFESGTQTGSTGPEVPTAPPKNNVKHNGK